MKIPVIIAITGDDGYNQQEKAKKSGMNILTPKPIKSRDLGNLLHNYGLI